MFFLREYKSEDAELIVKWLDSESTFFNWSRDEKRLEDKPCPSTNLSLKSI